MSIMQLWVIIDTQERTPTLLLYLAERVLVDPYLNLFFAKFLFSSLKLLKLYDVSENLSSNILVKRFFQNTAPIFDDVIISAHMFSLYCMVKKKQMSYNLFYLSFMNLIQN